MSTYRRRTGPTRKQLAASRAKANREIRRKTLQPHVGTPTAQRLGKVPLPSELSWVWWPGPWACRLAGGHAQDTIPAPKQGLIPWCPRCGKQGYLGSDDEIKRVRQYGEPTGREVILESLVDLGIAVIGALTLTVVLTAIAHLTGAA